MTFSTIKMKFLFLIVFVSLPICSFTEMAQAQWDDGASRKTTNSSKRSYPGGEDEEDLQVQTELTEPLIKITEQMLQNQILEEKKRATSGGRSKSASGRE